MEAPYAPDPALGTVAVVVGVSAKDALAWVAGKATDLHLLTHQCEPPEVVFILTLPARKDYRPMLEKIRTLRQAGAVALITRTGNPVVDGHLTAKNGCLRAHRDADGKYRFLAPPGAFSAWCKKWGMPSPSPCSKSSP
jgi:hypothetical protein